jgi:hypothetical protein
LIYYVGWIFYLFVVAPDPINDLASCLFNFSVPVEGAIFSFARENIVIYEVEDSEAVAKAFVKGSIKFNPIII